MSFNILREHMIKKYPQLTQHYCKFPDNYPRRYTQELATENLLLFKSITDY